MRWLLAIALLMAFTAPAYAYVDAGSGSYMLQMALAGVMALVFSIKLSWQRVKRYAIGVVRGRHGEGSGGHA